MLLKWWLTSWPVLPNYTGSSCRFAAFRCHSSLWPKAITSEKVNVVVVRPLQKRVMSRGLQGWCCCWRCCDPATPSAATPPFNIHIHIHRHIHTNTLRQLFQVNSSSYCGTKSSDPQPPRVPGAMNRGGRLNLLRVVERQV